MRLSELKAITRRMREIGLSPETMAVADIWEMIVTLEERGQKHVK